ncbi:MAG: AEC family transporter [Desulfobulbaceae bacterium]|nr:AEC family transporter [Desulfobulbaceae bacterium]
MENFIITMTYLLLGVILKRLPRFPENTGNVLSMFVIYVSLPALVLLKIPELEFSSELLVPALMPWGMLLITSLAILILARFFNWSRSITGSLLLLVPLGNTSFLGIPMVNAFFGEQAISYAVIYDQLGSFLALATYGTVVIAVYGGGDDKPSWQDVARKIVTFPPFISLFLAVALQSMTYPPVVMTILKSLSGTLVPVVMIAVGFQLTIRISREALGPLGFGLTLKLVAAPLIALATCRFFGLEGEAVRVSIFEAGMPPMVSAGALAILAGLSPALTAALVGLGIILSFVTLPTLFYLL